MRERAKVSQEELAKRSGVTQSIISALESGDSVNTTTGTLKALAQALGVTSSEIIYGEEIE
ncbi:helix-turn-helix domain-containing protein [Faecalibaculum rodentium]|uniref:helix-turn-helix domain-containing protein n=1 Tax=Faecalibaculum rodentium TaxID=1702221 RepID=UPI003C6D9642